MKSCYLGLGMLLVFAACVEDPPPTSDLDGGGDVSSSDSGTPGGGDAPLDAGSQGGGDAPVDAGPGATAVDAGVSDEPAERDAGMAETMVDAGPPGGCRVDTDCLYALWDVRCAGHWDCVEGECQPVCDMDRCGDEICPRLAKRPTTTKEWALARRIVSKARPVRPRSCGRRAHVRKWSVIASTGALARFSIVSAGGLIVNGFLQPKASVRRLIVSANSARDPSRPALVKNMVRRSRRPVLSRWSIPTPIISARSTARATEILAR